MKQRKKFLAIIMAVLMMVSVMPIAFAADCEHEFNMDTLVRPGYEDKNGWYVCAKCGENVEVNRPDFSELFAVGGELQALVTEVSLYNAENGEIVLEYATKLAEEYELDIFSDLSYLLFMIEQEQDKVDSMVSDLSKVLEEVESFIEKNEYESPFNVKTHIIGLARCSSAEYLFGVNYSDFVNELPEETQKKIAELEAEAEEALGKIENTENISKEEIVLFNGAQAKIGYIYNRVCDCIEGKHLVSEITDNGEGKHIAYCDFCGEVAIEEAHTWGEYIADENKDPCHNQNTQTAKCDVCDAKNTIEVDGAGDHVNKDHDDFCDVCDERIVERCDFCGGLAHKDYTRYICMLTHLLKLIASFFQR